MEKVSLKRLIGQRIQEVREARGLTQAELAARMPSKPHKQTVSKWETGRTNLSLETLEEIAGALGVNPVALLTLDDDAYHRAMEEAANVVEGRLEDLIRALRRANESSD